MEAVRNIGLMVRYARYLHGLDKSSTFGECFLQDRLIRIERGNTESNAASIAKSSKKEASEHADDCDRLESSLISDSSDPVRGK